jgi:hypothetical protein
MQLTEWQTRRLRDRLMRFRKARGVNGRDRPFERIALDILACEKAGLAFDHDSSAKSLAESLRRFVSGKQSPSEERLDALRIFLMEESFIAANDLDEDKTEHHAPLALMEHFGIGDPGAKPKL